MKGTHRLALASLLLVLAACATPEPLSISRDFDASSIEIVGLFPGIDRRLDPEGSVASEIVANASMKLQAMGYRTELLQGYGEDAAIDPAQVAEMEPEELVALMPEGVDAALVIFVEEARHDKRALLLSVYQFEASAVLIDRNGVLWHSRAEASSGTVGPLAWLFGSYDRYIAKGIMMAELFGTLPGR